jgi:hypothetical protein
MLKRLFSDEGLSKPDNEEILKRATAALIPFQQKPEDDKQKAS